MKKTRIWRRRIIHFLFWFVFAILTAFLAFDMSFLCADRAFFEFYFYIVNFNPSTIGMPLCANSPRLFGFILYPINHLTFIENMFMLFGYLYRIGYTLPLLIFFILFSMILWKINARPSKIDLNGRKHGIV
jgi:hypothetical protein